MDVHAFVFGEVGLLPHEYYALLPHEFKSLCEGYRRRQYKVSCEKRHQTFISVLPLTKDLNFDKFRQMWPLEFDEEYGPKQKIISTTIDAGTWEALKRQMTLPKSDYEIIVEKHKAVG